MSLHEDALVASRPRRRSSQKGEGGWRALCNSSLPYFISLSKRCSSASRCTSRSGLIRELKETTERSCTTMKKTPSLDIRTLRRAVAGLGVTLHWQGSQRILYGRERQRRLATRSRQNAMRLNCPQAMHHEVMIAKGKDGASYLTHRSVNGADYCDVPTQIRREHRNNGALHAR
jgi:hypothetical protein